MTISRSRKPSANDGVIMKELAEKVKAVSDSLDADIIFYVGGIRSGPDLELVDLIRKKRTRKNVLLMLTTYGGTPAAAYRIVRSIHCYYGSGEFFLMLNSFCKSAGTLIALGADELIMGDGGELGPLDTQLSKQDELGEMVSGLTLIQALDTLREETFTAFNHHFFQILEKSQFQVTTKTAAEIATKLAVGTFSPIYSHLDPIRLGENQRSVTLAKEYGTRIAKHNNNVKSETLTRLMADYPAHGFVIDRHEAEELFAKVRTPSDMELELWEELDVFNIDECLERPAIWFLGNGSELVKDPKADSTESKEAKSTEGMDSHEEIDKPSE